MRSGQISQRAFIVSLAGPNFIHCHSRLNNAPMLMWSVRAAGAYQNLISRFEQIKRNQQHFLCEGKLISMLARGRILFPLSPSYWQLFDSSYIRTTRKGICINFLAGINSRPGRVHYTKASQRKNERFVSALTRRRAVNSCLRSESALYFIARALF